MIPNCSKSYSAYEQVAHPDAGTTTPAGKDSMDNEDTLKQAASVARSGHAKNLAGTEDVNGAKHALDKQLGRQKPSGGKLGDATMQPNSGVLDGCPNELCSDCDK